MRGLKRIHRAVLYVLALLCCSPLTALAQVTFSTQVYPIKQAPFQVTTGDFNGDGKPDVAVLSLAGGTVSILLNNGDGTFASAVDYPAIAPQVFIGLSSRGIAVGDINGDNKLDLVVTNPGASVNVLLGRGDGTFQPPISTTPASLGDFIGSLGDFNGDKKLDTAVSCCARMTPLLGNGDGTFNNGTELLLGFGTENPIVADVNQDGKLDLVFSEGSFFEVLLGKGDGTFQSPLHATSLAPNAFFLRTGDFNQDGKTDLISSSSQFYLCEFGVCRPDGPPGSVAVMLGNGDGSFGGPGVIDNGDFGVPAVGDFDGDGNLDFAVAHAGAINFYAGNGQGGFAAAAAVTVGIGDDLAAVDFNGDGLADLVMIVSSAVQVALNTTPGFSLQSSPPGPPAPPGGSATYTINVGQQNGFSDTVTLACSSPVSQGVRCSLSQSPVTPGGTSTMTVTTTAAVAGLNGKSGPRSGFLYALWLPIVGLISGGIGFTRQPGRRKLCAPMLGCVLGAGLIFQVACGGGSIASRGGGGGGTPPGIYTIAVTGTAGTMQRSTIVTLTVR